MLTVGVDLAAEPSGTAAAVLEWSKTGATLRELVLAADDDAVIQLVLHADKAGIDCPLGWPDAFVSFVQSHQTGQLVAPDDVVGRAWRRRLAWRHTDEAVHDATGLIPLSVSADRIGHTAMRCASLQAQLAKQGRPVDRSGNGVVVEIYPAASLKVWGLPCRGYKGTKNAIMLGHLVDLLKQSCGAWLELGPHENSCRASDHVLDAVIAALTARAAALNMTRLPDQRQAIAASTEGWIAVPALPLADLRP